MEITHTSTRKELVAYLTSVQNKLDMMTIMLGCEGNEILQTSNSVIQEKLDKIYDTIKDVKHDFKKQEKLF